jgi:hypothetical protein
LEDILMVKRMRTSLSLTLITAALPLIPTAADPVWAAKKCPPLVANNNGVECKVVNYGTISDNNVTITMYDGAGNIECQVGPLPIPPKATRFCVTQIGAADNVSCEITGEGANTRAALSVYVQGSSNAGASVECR